MGQRNAFFLPFTLIDKESKNYNGTVAFTESVFVPFKIAGISCDGNKLSGHLVDCHISQITHPGII